jgi:hypothetical protein
MKSKTELIFLLFILLVILSCSRETYDLIIQQTSVVDVRTGKILTERDIGIAGGQIIAVKQSLRPTEGHSHIVDGTGKYVIPGLCDSHTHLGFLTTLGGDSLKSELAGFVRQGVLYVRDVGGPIDVMRQMQERILSGELMGPEIFYTGPMLESSPLHWENFNKSLPGFTVALDRENDVDSLLPVLAENGATMIKTFKNINPDLYPYIVKIARHNKLKIVHDPGLPLFQWMPINKALEYGITSFEHAHAPLSSILKEDIQVRADSFAGPGADPEMQRILATEIFSMGLDAVSEQRLSELTLDLKAHDAVLCPTLSVYPIMKENLPPGEDTLELNPDQEFMKLVAGMFKSLVPHVVKTFSDSGVRLLVGQDGIDPAGTIREMINMKEVGVNDLEILKGATIYAAEWLEVDDTYGSVEPGKVADLLLLNGNPVEDITQVGEIFQVIQNGEIVPR